MTRSIITGLRICPVPDRHRHLAAEKLNARFAIDALMLSGGGFINWSFRQAGLVDELSLVIAPLADGENDTVTLFAKSDHLAASASVEFALKGVEKTKGCARARKTGCEAVGHADHPCWSQQVSVT